MPITPPPVLPPQTQLDADQCIKGAYNEAERRLMVDAELTGTIVGPIDVYITDTIDSIKVGDGSGAYLKINPDGSINVVTTIGDPVGAVERSVYNEVGVVLSGVLTTIGTYTVPPAKSFFLHRVAVSGNNVAEYRVKLNGTTIDRKFSYFTQYSEEFEWAGTSNRGFELNAGDVLTVTVLHTRPSSGSFNSRIQGMEL